MKIFLTIALGMMLCSCGVALKPEELLGTWHGSATLGGNPQLSMNAEFTLEKPDRFLLNLSDESHHQNLSGSFQVADHTLKLQVQKLNKTLNMKIDLKGKDLKLTCDNPQELDPKVKSFEFQLEKIVESSDLDDEGKKGELSSNALGTVTVESSDVLERDDQFDYKPENVVDHNLKTAWCPKGGVGGWILFHFTQPKTLSALGIANGFQAVSARGTDLFHANARVKDLLLQNDRGESLKITLPDQPGFSTIEEALKSNNIAKDVKALGFSIQSTYPGDKFQDVLLSEVEFR